MSRRLAVRLLLALAAVSVVVGAVAVSGGAQTPGARTITLIEREKGSISHLIDAAPKMKGKGLSLSPGDQLTLHYPVFDEAGARKGRLSVICQFSAPGRSPGAAGGVCTGAFSLADGTIVVAGALGDSETNVAVVGGTGAYAGARGTVKSVQGRGGSTDTIELLQ